ncbi:hypothetical protein [Pleurochrysis sp. endemic virus 1b]|nr:hypothetical protein [Pleurochrysis sp. endemic virus 1b]
MHWHFSTRSQVKHGSVTGTLWTVKLPALTIESPVVSAHGCDALSSADALREGAVASTGRERSGMLSTVQSGCKRDGCGGATAGLWRRRRGADDPTVKLFCAPNQIPKKQNQGIYGSF